MWKKLREKQRNRQECTTAAAVVRILGGKFLEVHNETLDEYYDLVEIYKNLDKYDQEMIWSIIQIIKKLDEKRKREQKRVD